MDLFNRPLAPSAEAQDILPNDVESLLSDIICEIAGIQPELLDMDLTIEARRLVDRDLMLVLGGKIQFLGLEIDAPKLKFVLTEEGYMLTEESAQIITRIASAILNLVQDEIAAKPREA